MQFADFDTRSPWRRWYETNIDKLLPQTEQERHRARVHIFRVIAVADILLALYYFSFRYTESVNVNALWFAVPLLIAETYSFIDTLLFVFMMWKPRLRKAPPPPTNATVDVFITTYSEEIELVRTTAEAALRIRYPHRTYVLDDGNRPEMRAICDEIGCGYITRGKEWENRPRHAKAGNVNNALTLTEGDFILILDADQIPEPEILDRTLGYFDDPKVAFVQTPQYFYNIDKDDPFGSQAPLFYGPIQQGKDGWNAAFFCGSNAVLRREALFQLGLVRYVQETERQMKSALSNVPINASSTRIVYRNAAHKVSAAAEHALDLLRAQEPLSLVLGGFTNSIKSIQRDLVSDDLRSIAADLSDIAAMESKQGIATGDSAAVSGEILSNLNTYTEEVASTLAPSPDTFGLTPELSRLLTMESEDVLDVQPLVTFSITEDMATAMQLHAIGWESVFHPEILAKGLAPEDLGSASGQRLRWGAGTIQVMLQENPLAKKGLTLPQRLQYFTTMYSYFSGFFSVVYLVAPIIYLLTGIAPVVSYADEFLWRIIPYLLVNKIMFTFVAWGIDVTRGEQYSLALFPLWIRAVITVFSGDKLKFKVTPKTRQSGVYLNLVTPQLMMVVLLAFSSVYGLLGLAVGWRNDTVGVVVNVFWAMYSILMLRVILRAAVYRPAAN
jgi:cellulose synthase (UDP-forming)